VSLTAGQAAVLIYGHLQATWLARIFGLITIVCIYLTPGVRREMPFRWIPVLGVMGALDVTALLLIVAAGHLADRALATVASSAFGAVAVVLAWIFVREPISILQLAGIVFIVGGVAALAGG
jgi:drug/metabolite transporter (DMT)-like permease